MTIKLGQLLLEEGLVTREQLARALEAQKTYGGKLGTNLVELGFVTDAQLVALLAKQLHLPAATAADFEVIAPEVRELVPREFALAHKAVPLRLDARLRLAVSDPATLAEIPALGFRLGKAIQPVIAPEIWIVAALETHYGVPRETRYIEVERQESVVDLTLDAIPPPAPPTPEEDVSRDEYARRLLRAESAHAVFDAAFAHLAAFFGRLALLILRDGSFHGERLHGFAVHSRAFTGFVVPQIEATALAEASSGPQPRLGTLTASPGDRRLAGMLGLEPPQKIALYPVRLGATCVAVILGVPHRGALPVPNAGRVVSDAVQKAGWALEILRLRRKIAL